jgi:phosphoglycerol transferase MdoB-like AlkP superfamily enzyme
MQMGSTILPGTNRTENILNGFLSLLPANLALLAIMTGFRAAMLLFFGDHQLMAACRPYYVHSFWMGLRFDASVVAYFNLPVILLLPVLSANMPRFGRCVRVYYDALLSFLVFVSFVDFGFYTYFKDHINSTIFDFFKTDTPAVLKAIAFDKRFLPAIVLLAALVYGMLWLARMTQHLLVAKKYVRLKSGAWRTAAVYTGILCCMVIVARGGVGGEVLKTSHSEFSPYDSINRLSLNGVKTFAFAFDQEMKRMRKDHDLMKTFGYGDIHAVLADYRPGRDSSVDVLSALRKQTPQDRELAQLQPNVVFIVMESFGRNVMRYNSPDFNVLAGMEEHFKEDFFFKNILPPGWLTTHGIEAYFLGVPRRPLSGDMMDTALCRVPYKTSPAYAFKNAGYATEMIYGAALRLRDMDRACAAQGFDARFGKFEMPVDYPKNTWGVHDRYLFEFLYGRLQAGDAKKPKFIMALTCSNHPAFMPLPSDYTPLPLNPPASLQPLLISDRDYVRQRLSYYQYANFWLSDFITKVKHSPMAENTIVVVTGDHTFFDIYKEHDPLMDEYTVPLYVYLPQSLKKKYHPSTDIIGSSADVLATLYSVALSGKEYYSFGDSLMGDSPKPASQRIAANAQGYIVKGNTLVQYDSVNNTSKFYTVESSGSCRRESAGDMAMVRYYRAFTSLVDYFVRTGGGAPVRKGTPRTRV